MGKSPGKWIKTVLFGKKSSKSSLSKDAATDKSTAKKVPVSDLVEDPPVIPDSSSHNINRGEEKTELDKGTTTGLPGDSVVLSSVAQGVDSQLTLGTVSVDDAELQRQEQAATKAQAVFRGYLARRAFRALKGIIRLQALIRGHLVRRQAVATLRCMHAIVRSQALARGRRVRLSNPVSRGLGNYSLGERKDAKPAESNVISASLRSEKLAANAFVCKLLAIVPTAMPLSLQYDVVEPNSAWNWLERWSSSRFWEPLPRPKKNLNAKSQRKHGVQSSEIETGRPKRSVRKAPIASNGDNHGSSSLEPEKPKRIPRKVINHQTESSQEPQSELERVKRNLRKVSASATVASEKSETEIEKVQPPPLEVPKSLTDTEVREQVVVDSSDLTTDSKIEVDELTVTEPSPKPATVDNPVDVLQNHIPVEQLLPENGERGETIPGVMEELTSKEDQTSKESQRTRRRRSLPAKQEQTENISQNAPSLPSYMAATESAKAKLKAQGTPRSTEDEAENGFVRRHSLPSLTNGKLNSLSPRVQRPVQANGKGGNKTNRSVSSTRDDKVLPGWRR
ncbi:protein IQ-DOMAIN 31-like isoform X1 [Ipomoea triloba]|uniref:protein IQ-DOMAIN 31-like isoform X1 n=1 Tax=Ipomoea triloba TaxID=35885 RepID=UPI00125DEF31|nr:protein IQ-DOMAIN 31-like isoform X1 [Ipomoea triloba]XP_031108331.1 protein IQ-DOMAIN 31-like isoform X1 [Ipomoea triloba]XP_031108332.1 protein IQ-DOMAIN 31-like isoform X1 [Ipomoea triloba]